MSTLDVVAEVLREVAPRALCAREVVELAAGRLPTGSKTPETVVSRDLAIDVKRHGSASRFLRVDRGEFVLKEALPTALYNDVDEYAAQWTRNLIAANEIAAGVVDERSIRDLKPADVASYRQFHAFSGIGVWSRALRDAGWPDAANIWTGSCPCTPFSTAGRKRGFSDEQHLWPEWFRLIRACRPACVIGEQVSSKDGLAWFDVVRADLEDADYTLRVLDIPAACTGAPHARHRLYFAAYAREKGYAIVSAPWLHGRGQSGAPCTVPDAASTRSHLPEDARADHGDAGEGTDACERRSAGDLEPERSGAADGASFVPDTERVLWHEGWSPLAHGWSTVESDRCGEADGAEFDDNGTVELGDAGLARGRRYAGEVPGEEGAGEGEWLEAGDLSDEPRAPSTAYDTSADANTPSTAHGFRPGDRIRIDGDPGWNGAVRGFWADGVEWIYCRPAPGKQDGCWRPVESCIEPLAPRSARGVGRTRAKRLKGFGNSIVRPLAAAFVGAVIDAFVDAHRELEVSA